MIYIYIYIYTITAEVFLQVWGSLRLIPIIIIIVRAYIIWLKHFPELTVFIVQFYHFSYSLAHI